MVFGAGFALVALAVPGFSTTFEFSTNGGGDNAGVGGLIVLGAPTQTEMNGNTTTTVNPVVSIQGVPLGLEPAVPGVPTLSVWNDDVFYDMFDSAYTDAFQLDMVSPAELTVSGGIASFGIAPGTLLFTIHLASPLEATTTETVGRSGTLVGGQFSAQTDGATLTVDDPALLVYLGIEPASGPLEPYTTSLNGLTSNMDNVYYGQATDFWGMSNMLDFQLETVPEPGTLFPLGFGLAGMALLAGGKLARRA